MFERTTSLYSASCDLFADNDNVQAVLLDLRGYLARIEPHALGDPIRLNTLPDARSFDGPSFTLAYLLDLLCCYRRSTPLMKELRQRSIVWATGHVRGDGILDQLDQSGFDCKVREYFAQSKERTGVLVVPTANWHAFECSESDADRRTVVSTTRLATLASLPQGTLIVHVGNDELPQLITALFVEDSWPVEDQFRSVEIEAASISVARVGFLALLAGAVAAVVVQQHARTSLVRALVEAWESDAGKPLLGFLSVLLTFAAAQAWSRRTQRLRRLKSFLAENWSAVRLMSLPLRVAICAYFLVFALIPLAPNVGLAVGLPILATLVGTAMGWYRRSVVHGGQPPDRFGVVVGSSVLPIATFFCCAYWWWWIAWTLFALIAFASGSRKNLFEGAQLRFKSGVKWLGGAAAVMLVAAFVNLLALRPLDWTRGETPPSMHWAAVFLTPVGSGSALSAEPALAFGIAVLAAIGYAAMSRANRKLVCAVEGLREISECRRVHISEKRIAGAM